MIIGLHPYLTVACCYKVMNALNFHSAFRRPSRRKVYPWNVSVRSGTVAACELGALRLLLPDVVSPAPQSLDDLGQHGRSEWNAEEYQ